MLAKSSVQRWHRLPHHSGSLLVASKACSDKQAHVVSSRLVTNSSNNAGLRRHLPLMVGYAHRFLPWLSHAAAALQDTGYSTRG
jgi:hypothetical protein